MKTEYIKEWNIEYRIHDGEAGLEEFFIVLPSRLKVLWWFIAKGHRACEIYIWKTARIK